MLNKLSFYIKRFWLFFLAAPPRVGDIVCYYPVSPLDRERQKVIIHKFTNNRVIFRELYPDRTSMPEELSVEYFYSIYILEKYCREFYPETKNDY